MLSDEDNWGALEKFQRKKTSGSSSLFLRCVVSTISSKYVENMFGTLDILVLVGQKIEIQKM